LATFKPPGCVLLPAVLLACFTTGSYGSGILLEEDFSGDISTGWTLFGEPLPVICDTAGLPAPSFDNNGDNLYNSGCISRMGFDYLGGLVVECDMYVPSNERGAWISGLLGLAYPDEDQGIDGEVQADITIGYSYLGEANWLRPHLQGTLNLFLGLPDGRKERLEYLHFNECLDSWHRFGIVIERDLTVSYYVDSMLVHSTELVLPEDLGELAVVLQGRSGAWGRVFVDNLLVYVP